MNIRLFTLSMIFPLLKGPFAFGEENRPVDKPNIIFIMADDLGYGDPGCYGQKYMDTPNINRLANEGIRFTQAYAGAPVCTPSRCVLMTGLHNGHTPARDNVPHYPSYLHENDVTIAEVLKNAGYKTGGVGKWSLGDAGTAGRATKKGFDFWLGYLNQDHAHYYYTEYLDFNEGRLNLTGNTLLRDHYSHDVLTNGALQFMRSYADTSFFLYVAYTIPHFSSTTEDVHGLTVPSVKEFEEKNWPERAKKYAAMVRLLDKDVGRIIELVEDLNLAKKTLIIFTSDNGGHKTAWEEFDTNGPFKGYKRDLSEGGIRVPFIARWPGRIPANSVSTEIIAFQDMMPTFAELAGAPIPENIDGISMIPAFLQKKQEKKHEYLYWDYGHCRERYDRAVRMGEWKGIQEGRNAEIQLYNLEKDIAEEKDLAAQYPAIVQEIKRIMEMAYVPNERYPLGEIYKGAPIWQKDDKTDFMK